MNYSQTKKRPLNLRDKLNSWKEWIYVVSYLSLVFIVILYSIFTPYDYISLNFNLVLFCILLSLGFRSLNKILLVIHETGHFISAKILGLNPYKIVLGKNDVLLDRSINGIRLIVKSFPDNGLVKIEIPSKSFLKFRLTIVYLFGVFCEILFFLTSLLILRYSLTLLAVILPAAYYLIADIYKNLVPNVLDIDGEKLPNDGMQAIDIFFGSKSKVDEITLSNQVGYAFELAQYKLDGIKSQKADVSLLKFWELAFEQIHSDRILECYRNSLNNTDLSIEERNYYLDFFVTVALFQESGDYLEDSDLFSRELLNSLPHDLSIKGSRGCVLIEMGQNQEGIELLTEVMEKADEPEVRLISASYLALAYSQINSPKAAMKWLSIGREIDPHCWLFNRVEKVLPSTRDTSTS